MCYWVGTKKVREEMLRRLEKNPEDEIAQLYYKIFFAEKSLDFKDRYVAIGKANPELSVMVKKENKMDFLNMTWGLPWSYTQKNTGKTTHRTLINSTSEKAFFIHRDIIFRQRCVIPLDGYYEFFHYSGEIYPHFLYQPGKLLYAGGVWDGIVDKETGEIKHCFSILTTPPNDLASKIHNNPKAPNGSRMLLLLPEETIDSYLDHSTGRDALKDLMQPYADEVLDAYPVPRFLRKEFSGKLNTEEVRKKVDYPELGLLFN